MTITEKIMDLSLLWKQAAMVFPYFHKANLDWNAAYKEYLDRIIMTSTDREHYLLLAEFLNLLGDGHTDLIFPGSLLDSAGYLPFSFAYENGTYYVDGYPVLRINGRPVQDILEQAGRYVYHVDNYIPRLGYILPLLLDSETITLETNGGTRNYSFLKQKPGIIRQGDAVVAEYGDILYIRLDDFLQDRTVQIRTKIKESSPRAVILDVRKNIGGMTKYGADIASAFLSGEFHGCRKRTRVVRGNEVGPASQIVGMSEASIHRLIEKGLATQEEIEISKQVYRNEYCEEYTDSWGMPENKALFDGPCVLLTSRGTVSAAEDFAAFFRVNQRAVLIGAPTCGTTGTPLIQPLSSGSARICTVGYALLDGTDFIGKGIEPDIPLEPEAEDIRQGRDVVLEYALQYLK